MVTRGPVEQVTLICRATSTRAQTAARPHNSGPVSANTPPSSPTTGNWFSPITLGESTRPTGRGDPLDKLEEQVIGDLQTEVDNLEKEERSFYSLKKRYQELRGAGQCTNKNKKCHAWSCVGECDKNPRYMLNECTWSCGACGPKGTCKDLNTHCAYWACVGECQKNPRYMLIKCRESCNEPRAFSARLVPTALKVPSSKFLRTSDSPMF
ncbi:hypothetical protein Bbelb_099710 [Branchiostoma belcheri]|nr:hypothetical protein Bbelb_099710 [Branchiostoma belcheri]